MFRSLPLSEVAMLIKIRDDGLMQGLRAHLKAEGVVLMVFHSSGRVRWDVLASLARGPGHGYPG